MRELVNRLEAGQIDADLGGGVCKVRLSRQGEGKSGGYRVILFFRSGNRTFYAYGFQKSSMENINEKQLRNLKLAAKTVFAYTEDEIDYRVRNGLFVEI